MRELTKAARTSAAQRLAPFANHRTPKAPHTVADILSGIAVVLDVPEDSPMLATLKMPRRDDLDVEDVYLALQLVNDERTMLNAVERLLIEAARDRAGNWRGLAELYEVTRQAIMKRYVSMLGGDRTWPGRPSPAKARTEALIKLRLAVEGATQTTDTSTGPWTAATDVIAAVLRSGALSEEEIEAAFDIPENVMNAAAELAGLDIATDDTPIGLADVPDAVLADAVSLFVAEMDAKTGSRPTFPCRLWNSLDPQVRAGYLDQAEKGSPATTE